KVPNGTSGSIAPSTRDAPAGKLRVPGRCAHSTSKIEIARSPSSEGIRFKQSIGACADCRAQSLAGIRDDVAAQTGAAAADGAARSQAVARLGAAGPAGAADQVGAAVLSATAVAAALDAGGGAAVAARIGGPVTAAVAHARVADAHV